MDEDTQNATLPAHARLPINRCNLPAVILGSLAFMQHPVTLALDGVSELHADLFHDLALIPQHKERAFIFMDYMRSGFLLDNPEQAGLQQQQKRFRREKADYLRLLRGWHFNADGIEAAVLKSWVESRFGLLPRNHGGPLGDFSNDNYQQYLLDRSIGLYNSNALEAQLDLLYSYCQHELSRQHPDQTHISLYRGTNRMNEHGILWQYQREAIVLLNNLSSFTSNRERADEFGDTLVEVKIPLVKLLYFPGLLPNKLGGEQEHLVIGGLYRINIL
jgi:NAD+--dinitrogen-reductase ADP-D-ribosyltransferase